jgi:hypothetical protein
MIEATGMAKHVGVDREWHLGSLADPLDQAVETDGADWSAAPTNMANECRDNRRQETKLQKCHGKSFSI